ncbi:hypothetical protein PG987_003309 [Apiospora arundinis]|uniref:DUF7587 domain-containing protein n=1 Tax=Apiospora arundinis TaxID=335852 RepID=A0ABR2J8D9_9PEZI
MSHTPTQGLQVVHWGPKKIAYGEEPETLAWVVDNNRNRTGLVWVAGDKGDDFKDKYGTDVDESVFALRNATFTMGRPFKSMSITVHPCLGPTRPQRLFRVVHADTPFKGVCARDYPHMFEPLLFQVRYQKHMNWNWRGASPFMSATPSFKKALRMCRGYQDRGRKDINILFINTSGPWDSRQLIWNAAALKSVFDVQVDHRCVDEYLIMHSIPLHRVKVLKWDDLKNGTVRFSTIEEPEERWLEYERRKAAVRQAVEPDGQGEPANEVYDIESANNEPKRKRGYDDNGEEEERAPCRARRVARGFAPLKEKSMRRADAS